MTTSNDTVFRAIYILNMSEPNTDHMKYNKWTFEYFKMIE